MDSKSRKKNLINHIDEYDSATVQKLLLNIFKKHGVLESLFDNIHEAIIFISSDRMIQYHNLAAKDILGLPDHFQDFPIDRLLPGMNWNLLLGQKSGNKSLRQELELDYPKHRIVYLYALPLEMKKASYALILNDITESMAHAASEAEVKRGEMLSTLASEVAHEIGNPLNSLSLHLQYLQKLIDFDSFDKDDFKSELKESQNEIERLSSIITQFLHALRPGKPMLQPIDLKDVVAETIHFIQCEIDNRNIKLNLIWDENIPKINGDANHLKQALFNLTKNAMQAMPHGGILTIKADADESFVILTISDNGCGISPQNINRIFTPFYTTKSSGTGLGLMIVERIMREHGGSLAWNSEVNQGTSFVLSFPRHFRFVPGLPQSSLEN